MYWKYLLYVLVHKWYVFKYAFKLGIPLRGLLHDLSKFLPDEFIPYAKYFYGSFEKNEVEDNFNRAWNKHIHRNPHHFQHHILHEDSGNLLLLEMDSGEQKEMLADWMGAGHTIAWMRYRFYKKTNKKDEKLPTHPNEWDAQEEALSWYTMNRTSIKLAPQTRLWIEKKLKYLGDEFFALQKEDESNAIKIMEQYLELYSKNQGEEKTNG